MEYKAKELIGYFKGIYNYVIGNGQYPHNGLELAVAGIQKNNTTTIFPQKALDYYLFNSNVVEFYQQGKNVVVKRSDGRCVPLHPNSIKHNPESYVKKILSDNGMSADSSLVKKIAKLLERLKR